MSATPVTGNVYRLQIGSYAINQLGLNVKYFTLTNYMAPDTLLNFANGIAAVLYPFYVQLMPTTASFAGCSVSDVTQSSAQVDVPAGTITNVGKTATASGVTVTPSAVIGRNVVISNAFPDVFNGRHLITQATPTAIKWNDKNLGGYSPATGFTYRICDPTGQVIYSTNSPQPGTASGALLPGQVTGMVSLYSPLPGRKGRGRIYVPFPAATFNDGPTNTPTSAYTALLGNLVNYFAQPDQIIGPALTTASFGAYNEYSAEIPTFYAWNNAIGRKAWATQRRRGDYGKVNANPWG